eukprot:818482-Prymnesium_polylepis.2
MAQRWPSASRPACDARTSRAPARGAPVRSAPLRRAVSRARVHARTTFCCLLMARPDDRSEALREQTVTTAAEKHESIIESTEAVPFIAKTLTPAAPCPPCTNRPHRTVPCRAVPSRTV